MKAVTPVRLAHAPRKAGPVVVLAAGRPSGVGAFQPARLGSVQCGKAHYPQDIATRAAAMSTAAHAVAYAVFGTFADAASTTTTSVGVGIHTCSVIDAHGAAHESRW